jgi:hypothetical protein
MVTPEVTDGANELEQLKRRFEEFRSLRPTRGRLPQALWEEAAAAAKRYGLNPTAQGLRLDYTRLKKHVSVKADTGKRKQEIGSGPEFVELIGPVPGATTACQIDVESGRGAKVRIEVKGIATSELANLIQRLIAL